ncbi:MAG: glycosyl hydrolase family 39 [Terracidiphilus sp.]
MQAATLTTLECFAPKFEGYGQEAAHKSEQVISIQTHATKGPLPHVWEECVGSDRAAVGMRAQWLSDLELANKTAGFKSVRFHGLFDDEMGVWTSGTHPVFLYIDTVFDAMLERGVRPFVELSFMPKALASGEKTIFWYKGNTTPPKELKDWGELVGALAKHCVDRYGLEEVRQWNFEVWNEPNIVFWAGTKAQYFDLYRESAEALKRVDKDLRVGGPATAQAAWVGDLLEFCSTESVPIDFVSSHIYPDDPQKIVFGEDHRYPIEQVIPEALAMMKRQIASSKFPSLPLFITEWSSQNPAFIAHTIKSCIGLAEIMSYWTFDNVFEELGTPRSFLNRTFGLLGMRGIPRLSFHTFALLHRLGDVQLASDEGPILATRRADGTVAILLWNLIPQDPKQRSSMGDPMVQTEASFATQGESREVVLHVQDGRRHGAVKISRVDGDHGSFQKAYQSMGSPEYPTAKQIEELKRASQMPEPEVMHMSAQGELAITIPANGVALLELAQRRMCPAQRA